MTITTVADSGQYRLMSLIMKTQRKTNTQIKNHSWARFLRSLRLPGSAVLLKGQDNGNIKQTINKGSQHYS